MTTRHLMGSCLLLGTLAWPRAAAAYPIELQEQRESYMIFSDPAAQWADAQFGDPERFGELETGWLAAHADDVDLLIILMPETPGFFAYFSTFANDVTGIGYQHFSGQGEIFDRSDNSEIDGIIFMNDWRFFMPDGVIAEQVASFVFNQEVGHRWGAFAQLRYDTFGAWDPYDPAGQGSVSGSGSSSSGTGMGTGGTTDTTDSTGTTAATSGSGTTGGGTPEFARTMQGRDGTSHWNFYMQTGGSPMEGSAWTDTGDGSFSMTKVEQHHFSDLDLYLMGVKPADEVAPWFVIGDPFDCVADGVPVLCADPMDHELLYAAQTFEAKGTRVDITIDDVIAAEGPRDPMPEGPSSVRVGFIVVVQPEQTLSESDKQDVHEIVTFWTEQFEDATSGLMTIDNRTLDPRGGGDSGDGGSSDGVTSSDSATTTGSTTGATGSDTGTTAAVDGDGCGCHQRTGAPPRLLLLSVLLLASRRRNPATAA